MADDGSGRRCPECGREARDRSVPPPPSLFHWRRLIWLVIPLAIIGFIFWLKHGETMRRVSSGSMMPVLVLPAVDIDKLSKIAYGEREFALAEAIARATARTSPHVTTPGTSRLEVGFVLPQGRHFTSVSFGWPASWHSRSEMRLYRDAAGGEDVEPIVTDLSLDPQPHNTFPSHLPRVGQRKRYEFANWGLLYIQPPPEETGGAYVTHQVHIRSILASIGFVVLAWWITGLCVFLASRFMRKENRRSRVRLRIALTALAAIAVLLAGWYSLDRSERMGATPPPSKRIGDGLGAARSVAWQGVIAPAGEDITPEELARIATKPGGDVELARRIIDAFDDSDILVPRGRYLAAHFQPEAGMMSSRTTWNDTLPVLSRSEMLYERHASFDGPHHVGFDEAGLRTKFTATAAQLMWTEQDPDTPSIQWTLNFVALGSALTWLALLWLIVWSISRIVPAIIVRRRIRRGKCGGCGYILAPTPGNNPI